MTGIALMHGWGFDATAWAAWTAPAGAFPGSSAIALDAGYCGPPRLELPRGTDAPREWIGIGHSLGFARLLAMPVPWRALIGIGAFLRFCRLGEDHAGTPPEILDAMAARLDTAPEDVLSRFRRRCGLRGGSLAPDAAGRLRLLDDLRLLRTLDLAARPDAPPVLLLHAADDRIAPVALAEAALPLLPGAKLVRLAQGGHALPFTRGEHCIALCREFIDGLR